MLLVMIAIVFKQTPCCGWHIRRQLVVSLDGQGLIALSPCAFKGITMLFVLIYHKLRLVRDVIDVPMVVIALLQKFVHVLTVGLVTIVALLCVKWLLTL